MNYTSTQYSSPVFRYILGPYEFALEELTRTRVNYDYVSKVTIAVYRDDELCGRYKATQFPYNVDMYLTRIENLGQDDEWESYSNCILDRFSKITCNSLVVGCPAKLTSEFYSDFD